MKELRPIIKRFLDVSQEFLKDEKQLKEVCNNQQILIIYHPFA